MSKTCLLCKSNQTLLYGDMTFGECFCKDCYNQYSCFHCKNMNIKICYNNLYEIIDIFHLPLFGNRFKLFCESCYNNEDVYNMEDDLIVNIDEDDNESCISDFEYDIDEDDENNENIDIYYIRRGKYDIY